MKNLFASALLLGLSIGICAQSIRTVSGKVVDRKTKEAIPFSSVYIQGESIGTITNENGGFQLNIPSQHWGDSLVVSHIGFKNYYGVVDKLPNQLSIELNEALVNLDEVSVSTKRLTASEIFEKVIERIMNEKGYPISDFRMDGFYREIHSSNGERTGVLECAVAIYNDDVTSRFKDIVIPQFRKVYDKQRNTDQFIETKEGHNHLLLLLNGGINLIPIGKQYKSSIWHLPLEVEKITYFNDRFVYLLSNKSYGRELRLYVDTENYAVYKNELIMQVEEDDHDHYAWRKVNAKGEKCGAMIDHQGYEYREIKGKLYPYYSFRRFDFRCYDLKKENISSKSSFSTELLINNVVEGVSVNSADKFKKKQGLINRKEPYDSVFWKYFNDIQDVEFGDQITDKTTKTQNNERHTFQSKQDQFVSRMLKIGDHTTLDFNRADTLFGSLSSLLSCYDVKHYDLSVEIDPENEWINGTSQITFKMVDSSDRLRIDLFEYLKINSIVSDNQELTFTRDLDAVYIEFPLELSEDRTYSIEIDYEGHPLDPDFELWTSGFLWDEDESGKPFLQSLCQGYGAKAWWPVKNHLSDEPDSANIRITVPEDLVAVSNGQLVSQTNESGTSTYHWKVSNSINTYNIAAHIGDYSFDKSAFNGITISYYYLTSDSLLASKNLQMVPKMLEVYEKYFGSYPFPEDGFKIVQSPYPMEHQSCVAVGKYFDDQLILHESAHEWWGNSVSIGDNADIWIHEAFATYAESLYIEETLGYGLGQEYLNARKSDIQNDHPLVGVTNVNHFHYRIEDKYFKGALMLNTLRHLVENDSLWFSALKGIQKDFRHSFIDTQTLIKYFNEKLRKDYSSFFEQYLTTSNIPILEIQSSENDFVCRLTNVTDDFTLLLKANQLELETESEWKPISEISEDQIKQLQSKYLIKVVRK